MNKLFYLGAVLLMVMSISLVVMEFEDKEPTEPKIYSGPVPLGYNESHFRQTGETIREVKNGDS